MSFSDRVRSLQTCIVGVGLGTKDLGKSTSDTYARAIII